jgi:hypothetical protein
MRKRHSTEYRWQRKLRAKRRRMILELLVFLGLLALVVAAGIYLGAHYQD